MTEIFYVIVGFLLVLAVFDLFVGVSNDAVNFLNSAIGAKVAKFRTVLIVASAGVLIGAIMSAGMMDIARHGIMQPSYYNLKEVMTIFLAVMVTDVVVLDMFNSMGMPTSTTVSLVFELLGASFVMALLKMGGDDGLTLGMLLNSNKALTVIIAIFVSVAIAFVAGLLVQWLARVIFSFNYKKKLGYTIGIFGGIAFTSLAYFILIKGLGDSPFIHEPFRMWIAGNTTMILIVAFVLTTILSELLYFMKVNVFKIIVLAGTFALAMAFAGNDLVNFIGVPLAALDSLIDFLSHGGGDPEAFMMTSLEESAKSPILYLLLAGVIMVIALATSKKAHNVIKTSVNLSRQGEGDEMFGSSPVARALVRSSQNLNNVVEQIVPKSVKTWIGTRFNKNEAIMEEGAAFDEVRASVNLVLSALLIIMGTTLTLPLSTTYVTFMVAMGSSLADKAWNRETAVFRITGVISVIGGWFMTAGIAFVACGLVCLIMHYGGFVAMVAFMALVVFLLWNSKRGFEKKVEKPEDTIEQKMLATSDSQQVWQLLSEHFVRVQTDVIRNVSEDYEAIFKGLENEDIRALRRCGKNLKEIKNIQQKVRKVELVALRRSPMEIAVERNTWFHLAMNCDEEYMYGMRRMLEPILEHVDNCFDPFSKTYVNEYRPVMEKSQSLLATAQQMISTGDYSDYEHMLRVFQGTIADLSALRKKHIDRMQREEGINFKTAQLYLNLIQETSELVNTTKHLVRACYHFAGK
ncbi:MAG TPA: inorganic phosphate transporter [Candidatus Cryptobacteroides excrementigallinarum]|nr:inorganic phosphate transporter [Candidatus Cryptobacteroides excrementigallinarum]